MFEVRCLTVARGSNSLLHAFSHTFAAGKTHVILGPNGAGKSTLLLTLANMLAAKSGDLLIAVDQTDQQYLDTLSRQEMSRLIAWQGELPLAEFGLTVEQRLALAAGEDFDSSRLHAAIITMDVQSLLHRDMAELSSGERQRVELAAIMQRDVPIWLLDEPTAHLDLRHQAVALAMMRQESDAGRLIITVLHDLMQAASIADEVLLMDGHGGIQVGSSHDMLTQSNLARLFGIKLKICTDVSGQILLLPEFLGGGSEAA